MLLNVAIITHYGGDPLNQCVESLSCQSEYIDKIRIIVSSESECTHPTVQSINLHKNVGYAGAVNFAFQELRGPLLILNDDTILATDALQNLLEQYQEDCILQPVVRYIDTPNIIENTGHKLSFDGANTAHSRGLLRPQGNNWLRMCFSGAAFLISEKIIDTVGEFDPMLSPFGEDLDYSLRCIRAGFSIVVVENAIVYHQLGGSYGRYSKEKVTWVESHRIQAKFRSLPWACIAFSPISSIVRYCQQSFSPSLVPAENRLEACLATLKGIREGYKRLPNALEKRYGDVHHRKELDFLLHWVKVRKMDL